MVIACGDIGIDALKMGASILGYSFLVHVSLDLLMDKLIINHWLPILPALEKVSNGKHLLDTLAFLACRMLDALLKVKATHASHLFWVSFYTRHGRVRKVSKLQRGLRV